MRRRGTALSVLLSVAAAVGVAAPAAATGDTTVVSRVGLPDGFTLKAAASCPHSTTADASYQHVIGPSGGGNPGFGSLQLAVAPETAATLADKLPTPRNKLANLTALSLWAYQGDPVPAVVDNELQIRTAPDAEGSYFLLETPVGGEPGAWLPTDALNPSLMFDWTKYGGDGSVAQTGTNTLQDFEALNSGSNGLAKVAELAVSTANCNHAHQHLGVDGLQVGFGGTTTTYDFEAPVATHLESRLSASRIVAGKAVRPTAVLTSRGTALAHRHVTLWRKPAGSKYRKVGSFVSGADGSLTGPLTHPSANTSYQWRYAGDATTYGPTQATDHVAVARKVTMTLADSSVPRGGTLIATGKVTPRRSGLKVRLWRVKGAHGRVKLASASLPAHGRYSLTAQLHPGTYDVFVTSAKDARNVAGTSPVRHFTVRP